MAKVDYYHVAGSLIIHVPQQNSMAFFYSDQAFFAAATPYHRNKDEILTQAQKGNHGKFIGTFEVPKFLDNLVAESLDLPQTSSDLRVNALLLLAYTEMARIKQ